MMIPLKPCPFCGEAPVITREYWSHGGTLRGGTVRCPSCEVEMPRRHLASDLPPVERWNQRSINTSK